MRYIVFGITFLFFNCGIQAQQIDVDSIAFTDSLPVEIIYQKSIQGSQISLGRNHFLSFPGSFDDPSRLLMKYPGISTQNDQANFIIYDGMPPHYVKWTVYDTDIINPNHLSNAGTISDRNSRASGGVNSFSGQILGQFNFNAQPGMGGDQLTHAGSANMKPRTPFEDKLFFNISAIGLEAGVERKLNDSGSSNLMLNYRYSFTGLLGQMGVDFGGEVIGFQDGFAKLELDNTLGGKLSVFGLYGSSYNDHAAQDTASVFKDGLDIRYDAKVVVVGANHLSNNGKLSNSLVFSSRTDERNSSKPANFLPDIDSGNLNSLFKESKLALHSKYQFNNKMNFGLKASNFTYTPNAKLDEVLSIVDELSYLDFYPYLDYRLISNDKLEVDTKLGAYYETAFKEVSILPALSIQYNLQKSWGIYFNYNMTSQMQAPELYQVTGGLLFDGNKLNRSTGHHFQLGVKNKDFRLYTFLHRFNDLAGTRPGPADGFNELFTDFSNLDRIPNQLLGNIDEANIYGVSMDYSRSMNNDLFFDANLSIFSSKTSFGALFAGDYDNPYSFGNVLNVRLQKKFEFSSTKFLNVSTSFHYRGAAREFEIDLEESRKLGRTVNRPSGVQDQVFGVEQNPYHRMDLRISYIKKKSNKAKYKSVISMDIQNLYGRENDAFNYYDPLTDRVELQKQLGLLPVISYRLEF